MEGLEKFVHRELIARELEHSEVYHYLDRYMGKDIFLADDLQGNSTVKPGHTIWILWLQGMEHAPRLVQKCYESVCRNKPDDFEVVLLTEENLNEYIQLPEFIWKKHREGKITTPHLSDLIRIELLCTYGGCWMDATVFCSGKIPEYMVSENMFLFKTSSMENVVLKMSNWWLAGGKSNRIFQATRKLLHLFWENEEEAHNYFIFHIAMSKIIDTDSASGALYRDIPYFNNGNPHVLMRKLDMEFDEREWEIIKDISVVHKLTHKQRYMQGDIYNYYQALLDDKLQ